MERQNKRRAVLGATVLAGLLVAVTPAAAQPETAAGAGHTAAVRACGAVPLPVPDGAFGTVRGGDRTGRYLVGNLQDRPEGALWRDGRFVKLDTSSIPNAQVDFHDVNTKGVVVGERMTDYQSFHTDAFTLFNGVYTFLPPLRPGDSTQALGINSRGDVVGNSVGDGNGWRPVVWSADAPGTVRALPFPAGHTGDGRALGIDEDGTVVGYLSPQPPVVPFVWPATGTPHALPLPTGSIGGEAVAIQGGMIAGDASDPATNAGRPALWNLRTGAFTMFAQASGGSLSVNASGTIGLDRGGILHADGRVSSLGTGALVNVVADNGVAAGTTQQFNGQAVRWTGC